MREFQVAIDAEDWAHEYLKSCLQKKLEETCSFTLKKIYWGAKDGTLYIALTTDHDEIFEDWNTGKQSEEKIAYFLGDLSNAPGVHYCIAVTNLFAGNISFWSTTFDEITKFQHHETFSKRIPSFFRFTQPAGTAKDENDPHKAD